MKIKLYRSSTVGITTSSTTILTDPWLVDGAYYGSWSHFPPFDLEKNIQEINSYKAIYISHIHPDHCSKKTLQKMDKSIPVFIHKFHNNFLKLTIERMGFKVIEVENGKKTQIYKNTYITIFAADDCNPELCYKFTGCADLTAKGTSQQIDTLCVIEDNKNVLVNLNDCPYELAQYPLQKVKNNFPDIDILLSGYGGAGPYPQCFDNLNESEKIIEGNKKKENFLQQLMNFIKILKPKYYLPYAGTYTLSGFLSEKQNQIGVPSLDEAYQYIDSHLSKDNNLSDIKSIKIGPDQSYDINNHIFNEKYKSVNLKEQKRYISEILSKKKLDYENDLMPDKKEIFSLASSAYQNYLDKKKLFQSKIDTDILIDFKEAMLVLKYDKNDILLENSSYRSERKYIKLKIDSRLLKKVLMGPKYAHWNNAEIGSHVSYYRSPNIYNRNLHLSLCYFHNN